MEQILNKLSEIEVYSQCHHAGRCATETALSEEARKTDEGIRRFT